MAIYTESYRASGMWIEIPTKGRGYLTAYSSYRASGMWIEMSSIGSTIYLLFVIPRERYVD